jgi:hypothetical protein
MYNTRQAHTKATYLYESLRKFQPFHLALHMYDRVHVTLEQRTFESLAREAEQAYASTHGYGTAAVAAEDTHTLVARLVAEALAAQRVAPIPRATTTTPAVTTTTKAPKAPRQSAYCCTHGRIG